MALVMSILSYSHRFIGNHGVPEVPAFLVCAKLECKKARYCHEIPPLGLLLPCHAFGRFDVRPRHCMHSMKGNGHGGNMSSHRQSKDEPMLSASCGLTRGHSQRAPQSRTASALHAPYSQSMLHSEYPSHQRHCILLFFVSRRGCCSSWGYLSRSCNALPSGGRFCKKKSSS